MQCLFIKTIVENEYDKLGQLKKKKLAPAYNSNAGLETQGYDYNIRGWMLGTNRDYITEASSRWFGFDLGYDKTSHIISGASYSAAQYNGNIEGITWRSKGDAERRKYDFTYDAVNRLQKGDFTQYTSGSFSTSAGVNFTMGGDPGGDGKMKYDANGNITEMWQKGLTITGSDWIDKLAYTYTDHSNKLKNVIDGQNNVNTKLGDFRSSQLYMTALGTKTSSATDYVYDDNGNMIKDRK